MFQTSPADPRPIPYQTPKHPKPNPTQPNPTKRNPPQKELDKGISAEMAVQKESRFFENDPFWGADQLAALRPRFGVDGLRKELSVQLVRVVCEELPKMRKAVHESLQAVSTQLGRAV
jgi:hypothetical protein